MCSADKREISYSVSASFATQYQVQGCNTVVPVQKAENFDLVKLKEMLKAQQTQLNQLAQSLQHLQSYLALGCLQSTNPIICRRCHQPGHMAQKCTRAYNWSVERISGQQGDSQHQIRLSKNSLPLNCGATLQEG